jgi:energy-coupling factor transporter ATP-binding protein EcfA2
MMVRLAFAVMVQADADIMLIDEVLAVGDAAFAQKCMDVFQERRRAGKTILLVTHDMATVESMCDRAMLIHDGQVEHIGDPVETALRYYRRNFTKAVESGEGDVSAVPDFNATVVHARLRNSRGEEIENLEQGEPVVLDALIEARKDLGEPGFEFQVMNADGKVVLGFRRGLAEGDSGPIEAGRRIRLSGSIENRLVPGRYSVDCWVRRDGSQGELAVQGLRLLDFVVYGTSQETGVVAASTDVEAMAEPR